MGNIERSAREVAGDMPRETFEKAVEAAAAAVCAHRSYRMIAAEVLASVNHAGAVEALQQIASDDCMIVRGGETGDWIDTGAPQRIAQDALDALRGAVGHGRDGQNGQKKGRNDA
jgi:hypothetical protein